MLSVEHGSVLQEDPGKIGRVMSSIDMGIIGTLDTPHESALCEKELLSYVPQLGRERAW